MAQNSNKYCMKQVFFIFLRFIDYKLHKVLRQNSKTLKVLHQRKSLGNPGLKKNAILSNTFHPKEAGSFGKPAISGRIYTKLTDTRQKVMCADVKVLLQER